MTATTETYPYQKGKILYTNFSEHCHMADGSGLKGLITPLAGADYLQKYPENIHCIIGTVIKGAIMIA